MTLNNLAIVFTDAHTFKQLNLDASPALLLGMNAMRAFKKVSIDFANRKFRVRAARNQRARNPLRRRSPVGRLAARLWRRAVTAALKG